MSGKASLKIGEKVYCIHCKKEMTVTAIHATNDFGIFYGLDGEDPAKQGEGHGRTELRKTRGRKRVESR